MPKLRREEVADLDVKTLDEQEYTEGDFDVYEGEIPPANTELTGYVKNLWWCRTAEKDDGTGLDPMIKVLWVAADNEGDNEEFNGLGIWENLVLVPGAKFRWAPFLNTHGITLKEIKSSTYVGEEDDERVGGAPIEKIGNFEPGEEHDEAWSRVITKRRFYNEEWRAEAKSWLPWADGEAPDDGEEPADPEDTADGETGGEDVLTNEAGEELFEDENGEIVDAEGNFYELDDEGNYVLVEEEPEPEPEPEPAKPARGRRTAAKPAAASKPAAAKPAAARPAGRAAAAKPAATVSSRRAAKPAAAAAAKPAATGRGRGKAATKPAAQDNEPPF
jgi:hypothetical protein